MGQVIQAFRARERSNHERFVDLARSFPTLERAPMLDRDGWFDPRILHRWALQQYSSGARTSAQFVLRVWNDHRWKIGRFDIVSALTTWDTEHRAAFLAWAREPWWP